jgi:hypothetical protein
MLILRRIKQGRLFVLATALLLVTACSLPALPFVGAEPTPTLPPVEGMEATVTESAEPVESEEPVETEMPETPTPTATPEAEMTTPSPVPIFTPATASPEATATATSIPGPAGLKFTAYADPEYGFSLDYPQDWVLDTPRAGTVAFVPSGEALIQGTGAFFGLDAVTWSGDTAEEVLESYVDHMARTAPEVETTDPRQVVVGNVMGMGIDLHSVNEISGETTQGFALSAVAGGRGYVVVAAALEKDWPRLSTIFTKMVESAQFADGELLEIPAVTGTPTATPGIETPALSPTPGGEQPGVERTPIGTPVPPGEALSLQVMAGVSPGFVHVALFNYSGQNWYVDDLDLASGVLNLEIMDPATGLRISRVLPVAPAEPATRLLPPGEALDVKIRLTGAYAFARSGTYRVVAIYQSAHNAAGGQPFWQGMLTSAPVDVYVP